MGCPQKGHCTSEDRFELKRSDGAIFIVHVCRRCGILVMTPELLGKLKVNRFQIYGRKDD